MGRERYSLTNISKTIVLVRGGGDLATGVVQKFYRAGFKVVVLETEKPLAIRRTVSLCSAVYEGEYQVEDMHACLVASPKECQKVSRAWEQGKIPILVDPKAEQLANLKPQILIDAIMAKKNLGTHKDMAGVTIALGPGFEAGVDVDVVIETKRGHDLGKLYFKGAAFPNTGIPGEIDGKSKERVIHAPCSGIIKHNKEIGSQVKKGEVIFFVGEKEIHSPLSGTLRGLIHEGLSVNKGLKCADIDPRIVDCYSISDKARALGGAALEAAMMLIRAPSMTHSIRTRFYMNYKPPFLR